MFAAEKGHTEVVGCLLEHGADVRATNRVRCDASVGGWLAMVGMTRLCMMRHCCMWVHVLQNGRTSPLLAARNGHAGVVQCFLDHGADVNAVGKVWCDVIMR